MDGDALLGRWARRALLLLGVGLIAAALLYAYGFAINVLVGLAEPVHPTGLVWTLIAFEALFPFLLIATGILSLRCRTRRALRVLGALAVVAAANLAVTLILLPQAERSVCLQAIATQGAHPFDTSCLTEN